MSLINNNNAKNALPVILQEHQTNSLSCFLQLIDGTELAILAAAENKISLQRWLKVMVCSDYVSRQLTVHKNSIFEHWLMGDYDRAMKKNEIAEKLAVDMEEVRTEAQLLQVLRLFRHRQMVRICYRDINGLAALNEVCFELSELASATIKLALQWLEKTQQKEFGLALDQQGKTMPLIVIAMGKLGAYELNFSSDIDLIFAFSDHGQTVSGPRSISHNEYFIKLGQRLIKTLDQQTADGFVFRVDMRLRPFGHSGPLVVSYHALEDYYEKHGREWERYALIKARVVTGCRRDKEVLSTLLNPFVFRRYIDYGVFESLREMKSMIAREVKQKKKEHNVKLGAGGIREIEFMAQVFQLVRGGQDHHLQQRPVQKILDYIGEQLILPQPLVEELLNSYDLLRRTEHRIQQINDQQSHDIPENDFPRAQIAYGMEYAQWEQFAEKLKSVRKQVHGYFEQLLQPADVQMKNTNEVIADDHKEELKGIWQTSVSDDQAVKILSQRGAQNVLSLISLLKRFKNSHHCRKMSNEGSQRLDKLMPQVLELVLLLDNCETSLKRILNVLENVCRRSVYLSLLIENPQALSQLVKLCSASPWITRLLTQYPVLFDELLDNRALYTPLNKDTLFQELRERINSIPPADLEQRMEILHHFKQSQVFRVAVADVAGLIPIERVSDYLTWIAEVIIVTVLQSAWLDLTARYGEPQSSSKVKALSYGFGLIGFGKMGGLELGYSSDLDLVFIFSESLNDGKTDGGQNQPGQMIDNLQFYSKLTLRIMHILQTRTHSGILYETDVRLRPNGHSGLITSSLKAFKEYQLYNAWTWEHQALVRARFIAGDKLLAADFETVRREVLLQSRETGILKKEICDMRIKMRHALAKKRKGYFDIKQDSGGIADIEFIVQFMVLNHACEHPELLDWTDNERILVLLSKRALLPAETAKDLGEFYRLFRERLHQLSLQEVAGLIPLEEFLEERKKIQSHWHEIME